MPTVEPELTTMTLPKVAELFPDTVMMLAPGLVIVMSPFRVGNGWGALAVASQDAERPFLPRRAFLFARKIAITLKRQT